MLKDSIQQLELSLLNPEIRKSRSVLDSLITDEFLEIGASGNVYNKDDILNMDVIDKGMFGINLHHGYNSALVFNNSAGCQVLKNPTDLTKVLDLCKLHQAVYGRGINYTLLR